MSEQFISNESISTQVYDPTEHELRNGFELGPDQVISMNIIPGDVPFATLEGNGTKLDGFLVAEIDFGGDTTFATARVLDLNKGVLEEGASHVVHVSSQDGTFLYGGWLTKDGVFEFGRNTPEGHKLPDTVSRKHFSMALDESGNNLLVENHNPTNKTVVRRPSGNRRHQQPTHQFVVARQPGGGRDRVVRKR